jgi:light-regulated signal transduction histidine kinase (bacteriophytochrome)
VTDSQQIDFLAPGTPVDLGNCEREPIHVPGSIQPRGVLLVVSDPNRPLEQLCDELLGRLLPDRAEDDVALVAVRLRPQDGPGQPPT